MREGLAREIWQLKWQVSLATASLDFSEDAPARNRLCFRQLLKPKQSRNDRNLPLPSIGVAKLKQLLDLDICDALELLWFEDLNGVFWTRHTQNGKLNGYKAEADAYFEKKRKCSE